MSHVENFIRNRSDSHCNTRATAGTQPADIRPSGVFLMPETSQIPQQEVATELVDIPGTALRVSRVALGTWAMGGWMWGGTDERESLATIRAALDSGHQPNRYGAGVRLWRIRRDRRQSACRRGRAFTGGYCHQSGLEWRDGKVYRNATRDRIMQEIDQSLRRLRTDYIDIYQVHWPDRSYPSRRRRGDAHAARSG